MPPILRTELSLPNDERLLVLARSFAREISVLAGFEGEPLEALVGAAEEACLNVLKHAFEPGQQGTYAIAAELSPTVLTIFVRDQGLPLASTPPSLTTPTSNPPTAASALNSQTSTLHGLDRIRQAVDEMEWVNLGREGKELRMIKQLPHAHITEHLDEAQLTPIAADAALAPEQEYTIRRLRPDDAVGVAQCIYRVYGYSYHHEDLYYPARIIHLNETGERISVVALAESGEVVGHYALERPDPDPEGPRVTSHEPRVPDSRLQTPNPQHSTPNLSRVAEGGEAVVSPSHRGRHLMERMRELLEEEASQAGLIGISGNAVTTHLYSQRSDDRFGARVCGLTLALVPRSLEFKGIHSDPLDQRVSCVLYFKPLVVPPAVRVHAPARHRSVIEQIYAQLGVPVDYADPSDPERPTASSHHSPLTTHHAPSTSSRVSVSYRKSYGAGVIRVLQVGETTSAEVERARRDLCDVSGAEVVYLELPLAQAGTPSVCEAAESTGFIFSGVGPQFMPDGDALRLQFLNTDLDLAALQIYSPFAKELVDYIASERTRVERHGSTE